MVTRVCVCLSAAACPHYFTDPHVTWGSGRGCPLVVHWADLQSVHGLHCYGNTMDMHMAEPSGNPRGSPHTAHYACRAIKSMRLLRAPFHFVHTAGVLEREREMLASTCLTGSMPTLLIVMYRRQNSASVKLKIKQSFTVD